MPLASAKTIINGTWVIRYCPHISFFFISFFSSPCNFSPFLSPMTLSLSFSPEYFILILFYRCRTEAKKGQNFEARNILTSEHRKFIKCLTRCVPPSVPNLFNPCTPKWSVKPRMCTYYIMKLLKLKQLIASVKPFSVISVF